MFDQYNEIFVQNDTRLKSLGRIYSITSDKKFIGTIEESPESTKNLANQLLKLISFYSAVSIELTILDKDANVLGIIKKEKGFYKDFSLFNQNGQQLATIKSSVKVKSPSLTVVDKNENPIIHAVGGYGATDFKITEEKSNQQISSIKRRSVVYQTIKENLLNDDGYYIDNTNPNKLTTLALIAMAIVIDIYFFNN